MKASTIQWHLARDDQRKLARFCDKHQIKREVSDYYDDGCFAMTTHFDNGGYIKAELKQGTDISENYQVLDYNMGRA